MKVILYKRVSTVEQKESGLSLRNQHEQLLSYCQRENHTVVGKYEEDCSGKNFNRPQFNELLEYIKSNKKNVDLILITKWDRFGRTHLGSLNMLEKLKGMAVGVTAIEQPLDLSIPSSKAILAFYLAIPEVENEMIGLRTKEALRKGNKEGLWMSLAPYGYRNYRNDLKQSILVPDDNAIFIKEAFERVASQVQPMGIIREEMRKKGMKIVKQTFFNMLKNPVYIGLIRMKAWKDEPKQTVKGLHQPIIEEELFYKVQNILKGRKRDVNKPKTKNENLPLRGLGVLECPRCGGNLTGSGSTSRSGDTHYYYHCRNKCKERMPVKKAHQLITKHLKTIKIDDKLSKVFKSIVVETVNRNESNQENEINKLIKQKEDLIVKIDKAQDKVIDGVISSETFDEATTRYKSNIADIDSRIESIQQLDSIGDYVDGALNLLKNLDRFFVDAGYDEKRALIGSTFPNKIQILKNNCRTTSTNKVIELFCSIEKGLKSTKKKKADISVGLSLLAPPLGLEPRTL